MTPQSPTKLDPWFYPVSMHGHLVEAGVGSEYSNEYLSSRTHYRRPLLRDAVLERFNFAGQRVLDVACNCGYWSAAYAKAGASYVLGVDGRQMFVDQANMYWEATRPTDKFRYRFFEGNLRDASTWAKIREHEPFDFTLCAGILYHVPQWRDLVRDASSVTQKAMLIDTRVQLGKETLEREKRDQYFNAAGDDRSCVMPNRDALLELLEQLGWQTEILKNPAAPPAFLLPSDQYVDGYTTQDRARVAIFCSR